MTRDGECDATAEPGQQIMPAADSLGLAAQRYAAMGLKLVPIRSRQKRPLAKDWNCRASVSCRPSAALKVFGSAADSTWVFTWRRAGFARSIQTRCR